MRARIDVIRDSKEYPAMLLANVYFRISAAKHFFFFFLLLEGYTFLISSRIFICDMMTLKQIAKWVFDK
jgi:hypothetical protein